MKYRTEVCRGRLGTQGRDMVFANAAHVYPEQANPLMSTKTRDRTLGRQASYL